jgi:dTMP kinase
MSKLIVLEGIDGSGKSTQTELVKKYFGTRKLSFSFFHFPMYGHNEFSDIIARFLRGEFGSIDKVSPYFVANIYGMDRYMFMPILEEALKTVDVVLLDRYVFSNLAYQGAKYPNQSIESARVKQWILDFEFEFLQLPYPDLNIFFDVPTEITKGRLESQRGDDKEYLQGRQKDIHEEDMEFQERVRQNYLGVMESSPNCKIVPCTIPVKDNEHLVISPENIFKMHVKSALDYVLFGEKEYPDSTAYDLKTRIHN